MESLLEFRWDDPIERAVLEVLSSVPDGVEQVTGQMPRGQGLAFVVYRAPNVEAVDGLAHAISDLGAHVRVTRVVDEGRDAPVGR
jgi:hypothetical protein